MSVNLSVDRLAVHAPTTVAAVYAEMTDRPYVYELAARKIGLSEREYAELRHDLARGAASYGMIPRRVEAMAARRRSGKIYELRNVLIPSGTRGWSIALGDGTIVYVPRECANLAVRHGKIAQVKRRPNTSFSGYFAGSSGHAAPVKIVPPTLGGGAPVPLAGGGGGAPVGGGGSAGASGGASAHSNWGLLAPLYPIFAGIFHGGGNHGDHGGGGGIETTFCPP